MTDRQPPLDAVQMGAYFALMEVAGLLRHAVEQQLRDAGDLSYVQFQLLARLGLDSPTGSERMTDLADGVVYSRSGLTYQAGPLEKAGLVTRRPSANDERGVTITDAGRALLAKALPGHTEVLGRQLFQPLTRGDTKALADLLSQCVITCVRCRPVRQRIGGGDDPVLFLALPVAERGSGGGRILGTRERRTSPVAPRVRLQHCSGHPGLLRRRLFRTKASGSRRTVLGRSVAPQAAAMMATVPPPISRRTRKDALENRERVLDAATELVRSHGEKVPMGKIAERAGVGVGTVYRHFATREDLLGALVHRSFGIALANAGAAAAHPGPALEGVRRFFLTTLRDRERFVLPLHGGPAIFTPATRQRQADVRSALRALLERGQAAGELRADLTPEDLIVATSLLSRPLPGTGDWDVLARRQIDLMIDGLAPRRNPPTA